MLEPSLPAPIVVRDLFPAERASLLAVLDGLGPDDWERPTVCAGWSVKDIAAHLVGDDLGRLSRHRDGFDLDDRTPDESFGTFIHRRNREWVEAMRRLSPPIVVELLRMSGPATAAFFESLDPFAIGGRVRWAGPDPAPVWLDVARELTERWHHQQQIRDAVGAGMYDDPAVFAPVLATFAFSLPVAMARVSAADGTAVVLSVTGDSGGDWTVRRTGGRWELLVGATHHPAGRAIVDQDTAWRMYTRVLPSDAVASRVRLSGDKQLALRLLDAVALIG
jgi:uncharacterized protein (TIGR03083 family)